MIGKQNREEIYFCSVKLNGAERAEILISSMPSKNVGLDVSCEKKVLYIFSSDRLGAGTLRRASILHRSASQDRERQESRKRLFALRLQSRRGLLQVSII
jgi:hypothetical protein